MIKLLHLIKKGAVLLTSGAFLWGCSPFSQQDMNTPKSFRFQRVFTFADNFEPQSGVESHYDKGHLLIIQEDGLLALDAFNGDVKWRFIGASPITRPVVVENSWVVFPDFPPERELSTQSLWVLDLNTGIPVGKFQILWPENPVVENSQLTPFIWETWVEASGRSLYFPLSYLPPKGSPVKFQGVFRLDLEPELFSPDQRQEVRATAVVLTSPYQELTARPVFSQGTAYFLLNGSNLELPDSEPRNEDNFRRSDVRLVAWSLTEDREVWSRGFSYLGYKTWEPLTIRDGRIYLGDWKALACVEASDGTLVWEVGVDPQDESAYFASWGGMRVVGDKIFATVTDKLHCFSAKTGERLWTHDEPRDFTLDSNGEQWGDRVYLATPTGFKVFDAASGRLLGEDSTLEIPGYRVQGIMPRNGDLMYIIRNNELVAVRLGSEKS